MDALSQSLSGSPQLFPHTLDLRTDEVGFIRLTASDYREASFLDERILGPQTFRRPIPWSDLALAMAGPAFPERCDFIFHIGHVGSTLLSRLLGQRPTVLALREPAILRTLVQIHGEPGFQPQIWGADGFERRLSILLRLWSRTFDEDDQVVLKASSFVSEMAADMLSRSYRPKAILMTVSPETYLATILGGANAPREAEALGPTRFKRLQNRLGAEVGVLADLSIGEVTAMSWACEMTALSEAREVAAERALWLDFDQFMSDTPSALSRAFHHLAIPFQSHDVLAITRSPDMRRYSKAPEFAYDAQLRRDVLNQARAMSGDEIRKGLIWVDRLAEKHPAVAAAITLST